MRALTEMARQDVYVDGAALQKAVDFVLSSRNKSGLWSYAYFWEPSRPGAAEADLALSGDLLDVLVGAYRRLGKGPDEKLLAVEKTFRDSRLLERPVEPACVAHGIRALLHWADWQHDEALRKEAAGALDYLISLKRHGHWEPHWYHAYGGMVELNAVILELIAQIDPVGREAEIHECITWLLSTREAWGAWHNEIGTGVAVRALMKAGAAGAPEVAGRVDVEVNGAKVAHVDIDPKDPFVSAAALRHLELTSYLKGGGNTVSVTYDGTLAAPVALEVKRWGAPAPQAEKGALAVRRTAPERAVVGEPVEVALSVSADAPVSVVTVTDAVPSTMAADEDSLRALVSSGAIASYAVESGAVRLVLAHVMGEVKIAYRLKAVRAGQARHQGTRASGAAGGSASFTGGAVTVVEGE